jgi:hypothetical protein
VTSLQPYLGSGQSSSFLAGVIAHSIVLSPVSPRGALASARACSEHPPSVPRAISSESLQTTATLMIGEGRPIDRTPFSRTARLSGGA